jgi:hypothetical protein
MASGDALPPFTDAKSTATTVLWQVYHRPRAQRKTIALSILALVVIFYMLHSSAKVSGGAARRKMPELPCWS